MTYIKTHEERNNTSPYRKGIYLPDEHRIILYEDEVDELREYNEQLREQIKGLEWIIEGLKK